VYCKTSSLPKLLGFTLTANNTGRRTFLAVHKASVDGLSMDAGSDNAIGADRQRITDRSTAVTAHSLTTPVRLLLLLLLAVQSSLSCSVVAAAVYGPLWTSCVRNASVSARPG